ncbi:eCIS core domain-containing protein [Mesorhizobium ciceri]|nr:DUF4157 domain-containing protein [Mesorhizobium ciceri]
MPIPDASACGGIFDVECNLNNGGLSPENLGRQAEKAGQDAANTVQKAGQDVANALNELQASLLSGPALEQAIISSRNDAINGAGPIPPQIRQQLTGYADEDSMNRVRYKVGDNGFVNLAHLLEQGGFASAVTLIDVVVFRGPSEAADPSIWAHELKHIEQYRDWGVHSFAVQYSRNARGVEDPAYEKGNGFWQWRQSASSGQQQAGTWQQPQLVPAQQPNAGAFCYINGFGRFGPGPFQQFGAPCFVDLVQGRVWGQVGP